MKYILLIILIILGMLLYQNNEQDVVKNIDSNITKGVKMEISTDIKNQWEKLFKYYGSNLVKKCQGATEEKLAEVEKEFNIILPQAFSDSFRICDERFILKDRTRGYFGKSELYSLKNSYYGYFNLIEINKDLRMYDENWKDEWIVFYDYETWFYAILDTKTGQVYLESVESGNRIVWANSYEEWLEMAVDEVVKHGEIRLEVLEKLLGIE